MINVIRKHPGYTTYLNEQLKRAQNNQPAVYDTEEIRTALRIDFNNKCYLCESRKDDETNFVGGNERIEHFLPHHDGNFPERKFEWSNLFLSCDHCNGAKGQIEPLVDCTSNEYVLTEIFKFSYEPGTLKPKIEIHETFREVEKIENTRHLLNKIYNEPSGNVQIDTVKRLRKIAKKSFNDFILKLEDLNDNEHDPLKLAAVQAELSEASDFLSFKISFVKSSPTLFAKYGHLIGESL